MITVLYLSAGNDPQRFDTGVYLFLCRKIPGTDTDRAAGIQCADRLVCIGCTVQTTPHSDVKYLIQIYGDILRVITGDRQG